MKIQDILGIDFILLLASLVLMSCGVLFIYSSGVTSAGILVSNEYIRQIIWGGAGLILALVLAMVNYRRIYYFSHYLYLATLLPLLYTCIFGRVIHGTRWLRIGFLGIQTSEFAKITVILLLARYLSDSRRSGSSFGRFLVSCLIVFVPMGIVLVQPDLGTALVFIPILICMSFIADVPPRYIIFLLACIMLTGVLTVLPLWQSHILQRPIPVLSNLTNPRLVLAIILVMSVIAAIALFGYYKYKKPYFFWISYCTAITIFSLGASFVGRRMLKNYQIMRLIVFLDPNVDPRGAGWNIIQSITAIGSGGLTGKGFLQGTQSHYRYLPEQSTDFIFSIFSEEMGFSGGIIVFALFLIICLRLVKIMKTTADPFGAYICAGISGLYIFHFAVNVGMTMGIMPVTGIPLLFMSYGGSAVISAMAGIGLALSIHVRRFDR
jgi:rod shape determining protein RodA